MERIQWVDVAKGWGIIFVIYGHVANDFLSTWLYTFHVPLFFFLSGLFFNPTKNPTDFCHSKVKGLLLPYVMLGIPIFLINLHFGYDPIELLKGYIIQERASTLWFIAALFMQFVIVYVLYKLVSITVIRWGTVVCFAVAGLLLWRCGIVSLPWNIDVSMVTLPFFCLGHYMQKNKTFRKVLVYGNKMILFFFFALLNFIGTVIMCHIPFPTVDLCSSHFSFEPLAYFIAIVGILAICFISSKWHSKYLAYIGRNSLVFFVWQQDIAIMASTKFMDSICCLRNPDVFFIFTRNVIIVVSSLFILTLLNELVIKTKLRIFIGR